MFVSAFDFSDRPRGFVRSCLLALGAFCVVSLGASGRARADAIDKKLYDEAPQVVAWLKDRGYHNVGVLNFRVQLPGREPSLMGGALSANMAERLENALVIRLHEKDGILVLHNAGEAIAAAGNKLSYLRDRDCGEMFGLTYPAAWGRERAKPDVFLTGIVTVAEGEAGKVEATVVIRAVDRDIKWHTVLKVPFSKLDSGFLTDLGRPRAARRGAALADFDDVNSPAAKLVKEKTEIDPQDVMEKSRLKFTVKYGDRVQPVRYDEAARMYVLPEPMQVGAGVSLGLLNREADPIGVVVLVNGISTLDREVKKDPRLYRKWVLEPDDVEYGLSGYYDEKKDKVLSNEKFLIIGDRDWETLQSSLPNPGRIEVYVFASGKLSAPPVEPKPVVKISMRGLAQSKGLRDRRELTLEQLRNRLMEVTGMNKAIPAVGRGGIKPSGDLEEIPTEYGKLPNPVQVEYYCLEFKRTSK